MKCEEGESVTLLVRQARTRALLWRKHECERLAQAQRVGRGLHEAQLHGVELRVVQRRRARKQHTEPRVRMTRQQLQPRRQVLRARRFARMCFVADKSATPAVTFFGNYEPSIHQSDAL